MKVGHLLTALRDGNLYEATRDMAAVLLRRLFSLEFQDFYATVSNEPCTVVFIYLIGLTIYS